MNRKEWLNCSDPNKNYWANKCREIQKSLIYNPNPAAAVRHHLMDTEEQRKYNDEHYEYFGFNQDGTFEYGKYIVFVTKEEHQIIHGNKGEDNPMYGKHHSNDVKAIISKTSKERWKNEDYKKHMSDVMKNREFSKEHRRKLSESKLGDKNPMFNTHHTDEEKEHLRQTSKAYWTNEKRQEQSEQRKGHFVSDETKAKIGNALRGKTHTDKQKAHLLSVSEKWKEYKSNGGTMTWNEFQKFNRLYEK